MFLSIEERKVFFKNWLKLLIFVNNKYKIIKSFGCPKSPIGLDPDELIKIRNKLWKNKMCINEYLKYSNIKNEDRNIVNLWNNFICEKFLFIKSYKKYSVFMDFSNNKIYGVNGISSPIINIIPYLPKMIKTTLIPFNGKIIFDSLIEVENITFGKNMEKSFNEEYMKLKRKIGIIEVLE